MEQQQWPYEVVISHRTVVKAHVLVAWCKANLPPGAYKIRFRNSLLGGTFSVQPTVETQSLEHHMLVMLTWG